jgi:hypothetical protein
MTVAIAQIHHGIDLAFSILQFPRKVLRWPSLLLIARTTKSTAIGLVLRAFGGTGVVNPRQSKSWVFIVGLALIALLSCSKDQVWTDAEKKNADYILAAFKEAQEATRISNVGGAGKMSATDFEQIHAHQKRAYDFAVAVKDETLDKVNSTLRPHWRDELTEGLRLRMQNYPGHPDSTAEVSGSALLDRFADWWNANKRSILIPN